MLARQVDHIPHGMGYEPKWDGWRCLLINQAGEVRLQSRRGQDLSADYPELTTAARELLPSDCVLDGEIVILADQRLDYTLLAHRHAAGAKAAELATAFPAQFVAFDLISLAGVAVMARLQRQRRDLLEHLLADVSPPIVLSPYTLDLQEAMGWLEQAGDTGWDGVIARPLDQPYQPGVRALYKIKPRRTGDLVVGGYRLDRNSTAKTPTLGSLQLGLYDDGATGVPILHYVGVCSGFAAAARTDLARLLGELAVGPTDPHPWHPSSPGGARKPDPIGRPAGGVLVLIEPLMVCEVSYEAIRNDGAGPRFRSNTAFVRWRPDKDPLECRFDNLPD